jgi:hypothetical protein
LDDVTQPSRVAIEPIPFNQIQLQGMIGYGGYGKVERAKWKSADVVVRFCIEKDNLEEFQTTAKMLMYTLLTHTHTHTLILTHSLTLTFIDSHI